VVCKVMIGSVYVDEFEFIVNLSMYVCILLM